VLGALLGPLRLTRVRVAGPSMLPTLAEGERLLARRVRRLRTGDLVVCRSPLEPDRLLVKRVAGIEGRQIRVQGDNAGASTDSRAFGPIDRREVLGVACYRYAPPEAAGWLHRPSH
jgi:nickel-type superoxide dismutase maturation protease